MVDIVGYNKFYSRKTCKNYMSVYYTYADQIDFGLKTGSIICSPDYFNKLMAGKDCIAVGYDREKKQEFLYLK